MDIPSFYTGRSIFLTGVTGFMGKVLLEKLLRCCPGVPRIYVLIRPKKLESAKERLASLFNAPLFETLLKQRPTCKKCVFPIEGDVLQNDMGMSKGDIDRICDEISIVFHCAASVRFQEHLRDALESNVGTVEKMLKLIKEMKKFEAFVHLSTAYAYCYRKQTGEIFYPVNVNPKDLLNSSSWMSRDMLEKISPNLIGDHPNTYTYTKSLAENLIQHEAPKFRTAVVRPSIVTATWKEPMPGWCDSVNGPVGLIITFGKGLLRTMLGKRSSVANFIPVDVAINLMIATAWRIGSQTRTEYGPIIYNCTNSESNKFLWGEISDLTTLNAKILPLDSPARIPVYGSSISPNLFRNKVEWVFCHWIPAYLMDGILKITRNKPKFVKWYKKIYSMSDCLNYFTMRSWQWDDHNAKELRNMMSKQDRETFYFDTATLDWKQYIADYHAGVKRYILHEKMEDLPNTKKWINRRQKFSSVLKFLFMLLAGYVLVKDDFVSVTNVMIFFLILSFLSVVNQRFNFTKSFEPWNWS